MPKLIKLTLFFSTILALILGLIFLINYEKKQNKIKALHTKQAQMLKLTKENLQKGDLVFRVGLDSDSAIISAFDEKGWSHVGFALSSEQIIHSAPKDEFGNVPIGYNINIVVDASKALKGVDAGNYKIKVNGTTANVYPYSVSTIVEGFGKIEVRNDKGLINI